MVTGKTCMYKSGHTRWCELRQRWGYWSWKCFAVREKYVIILKHMSPLCEYRETGAKKTKSQRKNWECFRTISVCCVLFHQSAVLPVIKSIRWLINMDVTGEILLEPCFNSAIKVKISCSWWVKYSLHWGWDIPSLWMVFSQYCYFSTLECCTLIQVICWCGRQCAPCSVQFVSDSSPGQAIILMLSLSPAVSLLDHTVVTRDTRSISGRHGARVANR